MFCKEIVATLHTAYKYGGFLKLVIPNNHGKILLKMIDYGGALGVPPFTETPIYTYGYIIN